MKFEPKKAPATEQVITVSMSSLSTMQKSQFD